VLGRLLAPRCIIVRGRSFCPLYNFLLLGNQSLHWGDTEHPPTVNVTQSGQLHLSDIAKLFSVPSGVDV
jgi:hypothetical protein